MANAITSENGRLDWLGVLCSFGCAVHCAAMPIVVATLPSLTSLKWLADPLFHQVVAVLCAILVMRAILPSYRIHRDSRVLVMASVGLSLLFVAAFVLPDACCSSSLQLETLESVSKKQVSQSQVAKSQVPSNGTEASLEMPKIVLVSSNGSTIGRNAFAHKRGSTSEKTSCTCEFCAAAKGPASNQTSLADQASVKPPVCEQDACVHASTYGRPLLSAVELASHLGTSGAKAIMQTQPFLSPLGGLFLIVAHIMNIRLRFCGREKCCSTAR